MKKLLLAMLLLSGAASQAVSQNLWYSVAAFASARVAERSGQILAHIGAVDRSPALLNRYAEGVGFLSSMALMYYAYEEAQK